MDVLDKLGNPDATTLAKLKEAAEGEIWEWLRDRKNRRVFPHRLEQCGYVRLRNGDSKDGFWNIEGARQAVYAKNTLPLPDRAKAARGLTQ
jgi:hypothetical protein